MVGSKVTGVWSHSKWKGISPTFRFGFVLLMFRSDVNLSMMKPRYSLSDTFMFLTNDTAWFGNSSSLDELTFISSSGRSISGTGHIISVLFFGVHSCSSDTTSVYFKAYVSLVVFHRHTAFAVFMYVNSH